MEKTNNRSRKAANDGVSSGVMDASKLKDSSGLQSLSKQPVKSSGVDTKLILPKLVFMFYYGGLSLLNPYLTLYYNKIGLNAKEIGFILSLPPFLGMVAAPFLGAVADKSGKKQLVLCVCIIVSCAMRMLQSTTSSFGVLVLLVIVGEFAGSAVGPILDAITYSLLDNPEDYGKQRLFASIGWGTLAPISGAISTKYGVYAMFPMQAIVLSISLIFVSRLPNGKAPTAVTNASSDVIKANSSKANNSSNANKPAKPSSSSSEPQASVGKQVLDLLRVPKNTTFFALSYFLGNIMAISQGYLFLHMQSLGASTVIMGLALTTNCAAEIPMFWIASTILKKYTVPSLVTLVFVTFAFRFAYYSFVTTPWVMLFAETLNGITFGIGWSACSYYVNEISPPELKTTMQGVLAAIEWGVGIAVGLLAGGAMFDSIGSAKLFFWGSMAAAVGAACSAAWWSAESKRARRKRGKLTPQGTVSSLQYEPVLEDESTETSSLTASDCASADVAHTDDVSLL